MNSPQRAAVKITLEPVDVTPFQVGDVIRYRVPSGQEVAILVTRNRRHESLTAVNESSDFMVIGFGDPQLPSVADLIASEPPCFTYSNGIRWLSQFQIHRTRDVDLSRWEVLANVPVPVRERGLGFTLLVLSGRGVDPKERSDDFFEWLLQQPKVQTGC